jgi:predicted AlkP superfamily phosphohydrolase/phosphomutase
VARRIALLGFDAMDWRLVQQWSKEGLLPEFARLLRTAAAVPIDIPGDYSSGTVWPSVNTGLTPMHHQGWFGTRLIEGSYGLRPRYLEDIRGVPFWHDLAKQGGRILLLDVPFSAPDPVCGGRQIAAWGQHEWVARRGSYPRDLLPRIEARFGTYPVGPTVDDTWSRRGAKGLLPALLEATDRRTRILRYLSDNKDWDFLFAVYPESHSAGHYFWHLHDPRHPRFGGAGDERLGNALLKVYSRLDSALHELRESFGDDTTLVVLLSHGMGPNYSGDHLVPEMLARFHLSPGLPVRGLPREPRLQRLWRHTIGRVPRGFREEARRLVPSDVRQWLAIKRRQAGTSWRRMPSFALPGLDGFSAIRVNLEGREPEGLVAPGRPYEAYLQELEEEIASWSVGTSGHFQPAVKAVHRLADGSGALSLGAAPDLMIWWQKQRPMEALHSPRLGLVAGSSDDPRSGEHVMHGLLLLQGAGVASGLRPHGLMQPCDIAPTVLELAGLPGGAMRDGSSRLAGIMQGAACHASN